MKKLTGLLIVALLVISPMSASALEALTDSAMNQVTAQAGVSIGADNIVIYKSELSATKYVDSDGIAGAVHGHMVYNGDGAEAALTVQNSEIITLIDGVHFAGGTPDDNLNIDWTTEIDANVYAYDADGNRSNETFTLGATLDQLVNHKKKTLDIDIANIVLEADVNGIQRTKTAVVIGLPTIVIQSNGGTQVIGLENRSDANIPTREDGELIKIERPQTVVAILDGFLTISAH
ncbi:MAG: hypothetical protein JEZ12_26380 [Desulfobacterium sp.]|nr:hypothetical protein [Desulfobacterium sp.]